jgi:hypothetical protein
MPFEFEIDTAAKVIREKWSGDVDLAQLKESCRQEWAHPDYQKNLHMICDLSGTTPNLSSNDIWTFVRWFGQNESLGKFALVVSREFGFGLARMFSSISEDSKRYSESMRIFYSSTEAEAWIADVEK